MFQVLNGDNLELLKSFPDNHFDAVVTDPPYGLGQEPNAVEVMQAWCNHGFHEVKGRGFMGKEWDAFVPQPNFWREVFRVLKPGGHVVAFYGTRTYDWGVMAMRFAGFEVRDCIQWLYGCLSDDTEILTRGGYIQYHKFIKLPNFEQQEILIYDVENDIYKWEKPERWNQYNINKDTCYRIKSSSTDQIVSRNHRCLIEREGKLVCIQAELLSEMEYMPTLSDDFFELQETKILQSSMQRALSGSGMGKMGEDCFSNIQSTTQQIEKREHGGKESIVEGGNNLSEKERVLFGSQVQVCEMPEGVHSDGEERWLCGGISVSNGERDRQTTIENGVRTPHRPQPNEQRYNEPDAICNEQGTQAIRVGRSYSTTLATITPIEYSGIIFCPTITTGAFVARREGKTFITGNSGFPKSHNISKAIDKMHGAEREVVGVRQEGYAPMKNGHTDKKGGGFIGDERSPKIEITISSSEEAKNWDGWGSALKPANEPIVLARKPLEKGLSIAENVLKYGTGGINIDECRVKTDEKIENHSRGEESAISKGKYGDSKNQETHQTEGQKLGRFPANLILTHHPECVCRGMKKVKSNGHHSGKAGGLYSLGLKELEDKGNIHADQDGMEEVEDWLCHEDCPIRIMDEQSGISKSQRSERGNIVDNNVFGKYKYKDDTLRGHNDSGGASRFFYCAKASKSERNKGLEDERWFYNLELITDCCSFTEQNLFIWEQEESNQNMDLNGEAQQEKDILEATALLAKDKGCCTTSYGKNITEVFPKAIRFTTKTGLNQIIELKTLNYYQPLNINDCIADVLKTSKENGLNLAENVGLKNLLKIIFTKEKTGFPRGVKIVAKETLLKTSVKDVWLKKNIHSTVKPVKLMQYLVRLITPTDGIVLDPFCGSGTTGIACKLQGIRFVGMEQDAEYCKIAEARINNWDDAEEDEIEIISENKDDNSTYEVDKNNTFNTPNQLSLF
jgi:DNA modification methylase